MTISLKRCNRLLVAAGTLALLFCAGGAALAKDNLIVGTTDSVTTLDPAKCYNYWCSSVVFENTGDRLLGYAAGSTELVPKLAADMPEISDDGLTYTFTLREDVTFHNGSHMTSEDVKFSLNRSRWINHPEGAGFLLAGIDSIETPDDYTVVIHLQSPDITFSSKLAYVEATIVPADVYESPDGPLPDDASSEQYDQYIKDDAFIGTGPYRLENFRESQSMLMVANDDYWGDEPANDKVLTRFFAKASQLLVAIKAGEIDVAYRHLTPKQQDSMAEAEDIQAIKGNGAAIRYLVFNPELEPADELNVRRAMAAAIDRDRIIENVLGGRAEPLLSMVPPGFEANVPAFDRYADKQAGDYLDDKVELTLWYSRGHYGDTEPSLAQTIARMLEETDLFEVELQSSEWAQFVANAWPGDSGQYPVFLLGWYPDYLDPDDYIAPFFHSEDSFLRMYDNADMDELLGAQQAATSVDSDERMQQLAEIQQLAAEDIPTLPLYVINQYAYARDNIEGVEKTMGPAQLFRFSVIHRTGE